MSGTSPSEPATPADEPQEAVWRRHRRATYSLMALVTVVVVGVVAFGVWREVTRSTLGQVSLAWTAPAPTCTGTVVGPTRFGGERRLVIHARRGMRCVVTVGVRNDSGRDVHLGLVTAPYAGKRTGSVVKAETIAGSIPGTGNYGLDATVDLDRDLSAGARTTFDIVLVLNPRGCDGGVTTFSPFPRVEVSTLGRTTTRAAPAELSVTGSHTPGCRSALRSLPSSS